MPRLCLSRKTAETIYIETPAGRIVVAIDQARRGRVKLCVEAPPECQILRGELRQRPAPRPRDAHKGDSS